MPGAHACSCRFRRAQVKKSAYFLGTYTAEGFFSLLKIT